MANQTYRVFPNKVELFKFFNLYAPEINVGVSSRLPLNGFCVGTQQKAFRSSIDFFSALAEMSGLDVDAQHSTIRMGSYIVFFNSPIPNPNRRGKSVEATISQKDSPVGVVEKANETASTLAVLTEAAALNDEADKKGSKDRLAEFAATKGVTLAKNKNFESMMADFKAGLESTHPAK